MTNPQLEVKFVQIDSIKEYEKNSMHHDKEQIAAIANSINEFGFTNPILVRNDDTIIAGHGRLAAARKLGLDKVPIIKLGHLSEEQCRALVIADNKLARHKGATWNFDILNEELKDLAAMDFDLRNVGLSDQEVADFMESIDDSSPAKPRPKSNDDKFDKNYNIAYNIAFDDLHQQARWFEFIKSLKRKYKKNEELDTIAKRLDAYLADEVGVEISG